jgi:hypothetical protein
MVGETQLNKCMTIGENYINSQLKTVVGKIKEIEDKESNKIIE